MRYFDVPFSLIFFVRSFVLLLSFPFHENLASGKSVEKASIDFANVNEKLFELTKSCEFILISICISFCVWCWFSKWKAFMHDSPCITHCIFNLCAAPGHLPMERRKKRIEYCPSEMTFISQRNIFHAFLSIPPVSQFGSRLIVFCCWQNFLFLTPRSHLLT